ncbi:unnamed protein product [Eretmochelys imbricata]
MSPSRSLPGSGREVGAGELEQGGWGPGHLGSLPGSGGKLGGGLGARTPGFSPWLRGEAGIQDSWVPSLALGGAGSWNSWVLFLCRSQGWCWYNIQNHAPNRIGSAGVNAAQARLTAHLCSRGVSSGGVTRRPAQRGSGAPGKRNRNRNGSEVAGKFRLRSFPIRPATGDSTGTAAS